MSDSQNSYFRLNSHIVSDAEEIISSRSECHDILETGDIAAAGVEPEKAVREVLKRRLSSQYLVTFGHIVDEQLHVSNEFDVIIADRASAPPLYTTSDGTQYVPYEAVYCVGEVKASYKLGELKKFCSKIKKLETELKREHLPVGVMQFGDMTVENFKTPKEPKGIKNPLFSFYIAAGSNGMVTDKMLKNISEQAGTYWPHVPCIITILSQLTILCARVNNLHGDNCESFESILTPNMASHYAEEGDSCHWIAVKPSSSSHAAAINLACLLTNLSTFLDLAVLTHPKLFNYLKKAIDLNDANFVNLAPIFKDEKKSKKK